MYTQDFWAKQAGRIDWYKPFSKVQNTSFTGDVSIKWFEDGELNVCYNCVDRHLETQADQIAIVWEPNDPAQPAHFISYQKLYEEVNRFAFTLKNMGVQKGDRVTIYLPMIPEAAYAMLACARIGAVHSVVFAGFSADALAGRINDCESKVVITTQHAYRGDKVIDLKKTVDEAVLKTPCVEHVLMTDDISQSYNTIEPEIMNAEDPLFILYTSGSTNKPKGVLHTTGGYLVYASFTHDWVFGTEKHEVYWCTADLGWITGHTYGLYGPLANGVTTVMFEGIPTWPTPARNWEIIDKHYVNIFYTAPTAIRTLMREGDSWLKDSTRESLRLLGTVGEPINPEAWNWYHRAVGNKRCPIVDTWWQTETGGILISPKHDTPNLKPGSAMKPLPGIKPEIIDGNLCITDSWPGQARTLYKDHARFKEVYFSAYPGKYFTGDGCHKDTDGDYWITGRVDDVINVSGHRLGTAEIESALVSHPSVAEAAVVGYPHDIKGQGVYAYVTLKNGFKPSVALQQELKQQVRTEISPIATPDVIHWAPGLPKTRSGKIMRRILRKIAENDTSNLGDTSTLADPNVINNLINEAKQHVES